ncbi:hypothetical protein CAPTEDRAFT_217485 [Capitella teleta]|uniref:Chitin-binding type-2 domain-containing protein n=1 Tax=Capitella teleta TaxID=283909 RepID=R7UGI3_CAPTE|nr:hypothetical protein CAPTEDRAFT_217485 [Capitella teleta]|eukprot:ELU05639.1 hypothetical protein CAPTEDRAFT_217485 [Capitella teleta]
MFFCFIILALASANAKNFQAAVDVKHEVHEEVHLAQKGVYHGEYKGKCGNDGFYYNDESSIVICSNGNAHIQPCAPGSKNSAKEQYQQGTTYVYRDLCDVNLVDDGYALKHGNVHVHPEEIAQVQARLESKVYHGKYEGECGDDGFYYNDEFSIVICSNGNAHIQPCAPGSKNSAKEHYQQGTTYVYRDFCDVNLVDDGYALNHGISDASAYHDNPPFNVQHPIPESHVW